MSEHSFIFFCKTWYILIMVTRGHKVDMVIILWVCFVRVSVVSACDTSECMVVQLQRSDQRSHLAASVCVWVNVCVDEWISRCLCLNVWQAVQVTNYFFISKIVLSDVSPRLAPPHGETSMSIARHLNDQSGDKWTRNIVAQWPWWLWK